MSMNVYEPVGVVSAISAYNFPFYLNVWKTLPALMTGCSVLLRPSPLTPLGFSQLENSLPAALPNSRKYGVAPASGAPRVITWRSGAPPFTGSAYNSTRTASGSSSPT